MVKGGPCSHQLPLWRRCHIQLALENVVRHVRLRVLQQAVGARDAVEQSLLHALRDLLKQWVSDTMLCCCSSALKMVHGSRYGHYCGTQTSVGRRDKLVVGGSHQGLGEDEREYRKHVRKLVGYHLPPQFAEVLTGRRHGGRLLALAGGRSFVGTSPFGRQLQRWG